MAADDVANERCRSFDSASASAEATARQAGQVLAALKIVEPFQQRVEARIRPERVVERLDPQP
jgi:hypothetical protein